MYKAGAKGVESTSIASIKDSYGFPTEKRAYPKNSGRSESVPEILIEDTFRRVPVVRYCTFDYCLLIVEPEPQKVRLQRVKPH